MFPERIRMNTATPSESSDLKAAYNLGYVWLIASVAALGGLLFGWDWVVIGGAKPFFESYFGIARDVVNEGRAVIETDEAASGWANSCALLGCLFGSLITGMLSDRFGRKRLLMFAAFLFVASSVLTGWAGSFQAFIVWRIAGAASPSAWPPTCRRSTSPRSRRLECAGGWYR
jgi:MFS family permease